MIGFDSNSYGNFGIKGQGTLEYNIAEGTPKGGITQNGQSTYSGVTNLINTTYEGGIVSGITGAYLSMFGTSVVNVGKNAAASYNFAEATSGKTLPNTFNIAGQANDYWGALIFRCNSAECDGGILKVPGIVMQGNSALELIRFEGKDLKIDLAGIKSNNFCLEYWQDYTPYKEQVPDGFLNAPPACEINEGGDGGGGTSGDGVPGKTVPGVPATALDFIMKNPVVIALTGLVIAAAAFALIRVRKNSSK
jgi:hypothetical protein